MVLRMENPEAEPNTARKRKRESKPLTDTNIIKPAPENAQPKKSKNKKIKSAPPILQKVFDLKPCLDHVVNISEITNKETEGVGEDLCRRYPVLGNKDLVQKFLSVPMSNNQKGRIRQVLKDSLKGTSEFLLPDVIHNRIQTIIKSGEHKLSETDLRKIRILYNMLKTSLTTDKSTADSLKKKRKKPSNIKVDKKEVTETKDEEEQVAKVKKELGDVKKSTNSSDKNKIKENSEKPKDIKPKGPKRYVVFVGNLPPDIEKEKILQHFAEFNECIVDIRIPKRPEGKKSSIAYVELKNEPTYELALSKHHTMLNGKRINVLYTTQKNGKVSKSEAKSKSAKLIALQKAGKLIGSIPVNRKRSHRRMKMKRAQAKLAAQNA